jgi:diaminobutyrate-2-oxoglutarate transaminase
MAHGLEFEEPGTAPKVTAAAFGLGLLTETAGPEDNVVKLLPPLTIADDELSHGLDLLTEPVAAGSGRRLGAP